MYNRMKNIIINKPLVYDNDMLNFLYNSTIVNIYKNFFLIEYPKICGLYNYKDNMDYKKFLMICDLRHANIYKSTNTNFDKYKMKNVYKKWLKL